MEIIVNNKHVFLLLGVAFKLIPSFNEGVEYFVDLMWPKMVEIWRSRSGKEAMTKSMITDEAAPAQGSKIDCKQTSAATKVLLQGDPSLWAGV